MRFSAIRLSALALALTFLTACSHQLPALCPQADELAWLLEEVRREEAPDARTAVWEVQLTAEDGRCRIEGATDSRAALLRLESAAAAAAPNARIDVKLLPEAQSGLPVQALVAVPTASITAKPAFAQPVTTQALMGDVLQVLEKRGAFLRVRMMDGYTGWVHRMQVVPFTDEMQKFQDGRRLIVTAPSARVTGEGGEVVSVVFLMNRLSLVGSQEDFYIVRLPDGRTGRLTKSAAEVESAYLARWAKLEDASAGAFTRAFLANAGKLAGTPYLWGGTSASGLDCSGFISFLYRMTGAVVPRDADQLEAASNPVAFDRVEDIEPGLLLFFGKVEDGQKRFEHVALSLGGGAFIHSLGSVRVESLSEASPRFSAYERGRLLGAGRLKKIKRIQDAARF